MGPISDNESKTMPLVVLLEIPVIGKIKLEWVRVSGYHCGPQKEARIVQTDEG